MDRVEASAAGRPAAAVMADYAATLRHEDLPVIVVRRAKDCLIDTVAAALHGRDLPWSRIVVAQAKTAGSGRARLIGVPHDGTTADAAALVNGVLSHAAELDNLCHPGAGVHPGAALVPAALAVAQECGADGRALVTAIVAGAEILMRVGRATCHSAETRGFHAPGLTGPFGAAVAAGCLYGLDPTRMANALAIAGSLCGGLLEFANGRDGGMVKRLHMGRAAQSGVLAARLARDGFTGPASVLEGRYGFLNAYCAETDPAALTAGLGTTYELLTLCLKQYPCHITAHTPIVAIQALQAEHGIAAAEIARVTVQGSAKMAQLHGGHDPRDLVMALYSIPFCVAVALTRDASDPDSFGETALKDPAIRALCSRITVLPGEDPGWGTVTRVELIDGRRYEREIAGFPGMPSEPLTPARLGAKFMALTRRLGPDAAALLARLERVEHEAELGWLHGLPNDATRGTTA